MIFTVSPRRQRRHGGYIDTVCLGDTPRPGAPASAEHERATVCGGAVTVVHSNQQHHSDRPSRAASPPGPSPPDVFRRLRRPTWIMRPLRAVERLRKPISSAAFPRSRLLEPSTSCVAGRNRRERVGEGPRRGVMLSAVLLNRNPMPGVLSFLNPSFYHLP